MLEDPEFHRRYTRLAMKDTHQLLDCVLPKMTFGEADVIMDVGCATGDLTRDVILPRIPKLKKLVAIDILPKMIEFARKEIANEKIEYHVADLEDKSTLKRWEGAISKVFSIHCFHWLKDLNNGFPHVYYLLKPQGEAAVAFFLNATLWDCYPSLINDPKWNKYLKDADQYVPESHRLHLGAEHYRKVLKDLGFEVLLCEEESRNHTFKNDTELEVVLNVRSSLPRYIPNELKDEFIDDFANIFVEMSGRDSVGLPVMAYTVLMVHVKKP